MAKKDSPIRTLLGTKRIFIPILFGVGVALWLLLRSFDKHAFSLIEWSWYTSFWIGAAILMMVIRDVAYMYRIRVLTNYELSWKKAFDVILIWEFASAITPSVVGGAPLAIFIVNREGIALGKSAAIVLITSLLDELFFVIMVPVLALLLFDNNLFTAQDSHTLFSMAVGTKLIFITSYSLITVYAILISYAVFVNPTSVKKLFMSLFSLPFLKKWKSNMEKTTEEMVQASNAAKEMPASYWIKASSATFFSWTARYMVINCLIMAFFYTHEHILIYARQLVMWVIMLINRTPGGSGLAEYAFSLYLSDFVPEGFASLLGFLWRLISYYPYLLIGAIILPGWITRVYLKRKLIRFKK